MEILNSRARLRCYGAAIAAMALTIGACDETPTTPSAMELAGRWQLLSLQLLNEQPITPRPGTDVGIEFTDDGISVQSDCNSCSGRYTLAGTTFTVSPLACTRRACVETSIEGAYLQLLSTSSTAISLRGRLLKIAGPNGVLLFVR